MNLWKWSQTSNAQEIKHNHICDICKNFGKKYEDENFEKLIEFVHENSVKAFTDDAFNVLERDQLPGIKNGPKTFRKANL